MGAPWTWPFTWEVVANKPQDAGIRKNAAKLLLSEIVKNVNHSQLMWVSNLWMLSRCRVFDNWFLFKFRCCKNWWEIGGWHTVMVISVARQRTPSQISSCQCPKLMVVSWILGWRVCPIVFIVSLSFWDGYMKSYTMSLARGRWFGNIMLASTRKTSSRMSLDDWSYKWLDIGLQMFVIVWHWHLLTTLQFQIWPEKKRVVPAGFRIALPVPGKAGFGKEWDHPNLAGFLGATAKYWKMSWTSWLLKLGLFPSRDHPRWWR